MSAAPGFQVFQGDARLGDGLKPPKSKNNEAAGAAWDVRNGKYLAAVDKLDAFVKDAYKSRLNVWESGNDYFDTALAAKMYFVNEVMEARGCICKLTDCE